jgi:hypothetical protein
MKILVNTHLQRIFMARNGSGVYELPNEPVVPGTVISSTHYNSSLTDIANGLTDSLPRSGEAPMESTLRIVDGGPNNPGIQFNSEATGLFRPSSGILGFSVAGSERMRIVDGRLILASTIDDGASSLQVVGNTKLQGDLNIFGGMNLLNGATISGTTQLQTLGFIGGTGSTLDLSGGATVGGLLAASGLGVSGDAAVLGELAVGGNILAAGVDAGPSQFDSITTPTIQVDGASNLSTLSVSGTSTFTGTAGFQTVNSVAVNSTTVNSENISATAFVNGAVGQFTTSVSAPLVQTSATTGTSSMKVGVGRTGDGGSTVEFLTVNGGTTYNFRVNRSSGVNGNINFEQTGTGRFNFSLDTGTEFRYSTGSTGGITQRMIAALATPNNGVYSQSISSVGNLNLSISNAAITATNNWLSTARNATGGISSITFRTGGDVDSSNSVATALTISETAVVPSLQIQAISGTATAPGYSFAGDSNTGILRSSADNLDFATGGSIRLNIDSSGRLNGTATAADVVSLKTTSNSAVFNVDATTATANQNNFSFNLTSAGTVQMLLRNDAKTVATTPISITRNATTGAAAFAVRLGGDTNSAGSDFEIFRANYIDGTAQGRLIVGHTACDLYFSNSDTTITPNLSIHAVKTGATGPAASLGSDGSQNGILSFSRTNTANKRIIGSTVEGISVSNTAGAERGRLDFRTKAAADSTTVSRATIDEVSFTSAVPVIAPKSINAALTLNNVFSTSAGFTINTGLTVGEYTVYNNSAAAITITQGAGLTLRQSGTANTGNRTLNQRGVARILVISSTEYIIEGAIS